MVGLGQWPAVIAKLVGDGIAAIAPEIPARHLDAGGSLPPQNATGNFVKVVQRVPVRITLDADDKMVRKLKAGMSSYVSIDTGHRRSLAGILGLSPAAMAAED